MSKPEPLRQLKRFVTTHDDQGKAVFSSKVSEDNQRTNIANGQAFFALGWATEGFPTNLNQDADIDTANGYLEAPPGIVVSRGTVLRYVDIAPEHLSPMHRTVSLDFGIVIEGEIELVLDSGETRLMKPGDCAIQRGTIHAWRNPSKEKWARLVFVLQPCQPLEINGQCLGEDLADMPNVRPSE